MIKDALRSYFSFSRTQRVGVVVLSGLLLGLILVRATMRYWVKPEPIKNSVELQAAWERFKANQEEAANKKLLPVHINTADSETLVSLRGIGPKTAHKILEYRETKGNIKSFNQLLSIHHFPAELRDELIFSDSTGKQK
jgi:hypothetical protein